MLEPARFRLRTALTSRDGAIDLASIMVGVLVIGIVGGTIAAAVFGVVPWAQDNAAKQALDAVKTAESVAFLQPDASGHRGFQDSATLTASGGVDGKPLLERSKDIAVGIDATGSCWVAASRSATKKIFFTTNTSTTVKELNSTSTTTCNLAVGTVQDLARTLAGATIPDAQPAPSGSPSPTPSPSQPATVPAPVITTTSLPNAQAGQAYSTTISWIGTASKITASAGFPGSLTLNQTTGAITGTPTAPGTFTFDVTAVGPDASSTQHLTLTVANPAISLEYEWPEELAFGQPYSAVPTFQADGATFSIVAGTFDGRLPYGLSLNPTTGEISGVPNQFDDNVKVLIRVTDKWGQKAEVTAYLGVV